MTRQGDGGLPWRFDHLGLVVKRIDKARPRMAALLAITDWTEPIDDPVNGVRLQFGRDPAAVVYELLEPLDDHSPVYPRSRAAGRSSTTSPIASRTFPPARRG